MKRIKTLTALISASLTSQANSSQDTIILDAMMNTGKNNNISNISVLNKGVSTMLAGHRSHSSHRSHRSSSGGGGYSAPSHKPTPSYSKPTSTPSPSYNFKSSTSDPLGQQARPKKSYPSQKSKKANATKADMKSIIVQVQLALLLEGLYSGKVDGVMGNGTRTAIRAFKKKNNITSKALLGAKTLNALGVKGF